MSGYMPFDIQAETMKKLPVKSLIRFRSVSKSWKSLIDSSKFIKDHRIHRMQTQPHHLFLRYKLPRCEHRTYVSLIDDDTFPYHEFSHTVPQSVNLIKDACICGSTQGVLCFYGFRQDIGSLMVVLWNPIVRKSVDIVLPARLSTRRPGNIVGFGVCPVTNNPKLVRIHVVVEPCVHWEVEVFTLSSGWKSVSINPLFKPCGLTCYHVHIDGFVYWLGFDKVNPDFTFNSSKIVSFDFESEEFGEVCLPDCLVNSCGLRICNHNDTLAVVKYYEEGEIPVHGVWVMDQVTKSFIRMFTIKSPGIGYGRLEGFRKNDEAIMSKTQPHHNYGNDSKLICEHEVYKSCSGHVNVINIKGMYDKLAMKSYTETLLLLHQSNSIIH